jgi:tetratricopeptide (TPR) repeat protein
MPRKEVIATISLRPYEAARGLGVTVSLGHRNRNVSSQIAIWESGIGGPLGPPADGDKDGRYGRLLLAAAMWIGFNDVTGGVRPALGTTNWRSYALFSLGAIDYRSGNADSARRLYEQALDIDFGNIGALVNLGSLFLTPASRTESTFDRDRRLKRARLLLMLASSKGQHDPSVMLRTRYMLALWALHRNDYTFANQQLDDLDRYVRLASTDAGLKQLSADIRAASKVLRATAELAHGTQTECVEFPQQGWYGLATQYNRAIFWARRSAMRADNDSDVERALDELRLTIERAEPDTRRQAGLEPAFVALRGDPRFKAIIGEMP